MLRPVPLDRHLAACDVAPSDDPTVRALKRVLGPRGPRAKVNIAHLPSPLPTCSAFPEGRLSPRLLVLYARAMNTKKGQHVLLVGDPFVVLAALLDRLPAARRPERITLLTKDPARARWTADRVGLGADDRFEILVADPHYEPRRKAMLPNHDQVLAHRTGWSLADAAAWLGDDGTATLGDAHGRLGTLLQHVRVGGEGGDLDLSRHVLQTPPGNAARPLTRRAHRHPPHVTVGQVLAAEPMLLNVWRGVAPSAIEQSVLGAVRGTFGRSEPTDDVGLDANRRLAERLFHLGYLEQVVGMRQGAEALYRASLVSEETAEAWTFYGWVRSQEGHTEEAVDSCRRAIEIDPTFGNPYNDIGAYLLADGDAEGAKNWFQRATQAPRYAAPHYPYTNLGRVFLREGDLLAAREAVEQALDMVPGYPPAERLLREIEAREMNDPLGR